MIRVRSSNDFRAGIQNGFWGIKYLLIIGGMIGAFFIPEEGNFGKFLKKVSHSYHNICLTNFVNLRNGVDVLWNDWWFHLHTYSAGADHRLCSQLG